MTTLTISKTNFSPIKCESYWRVGMHVKNTSPQGVIGHRCWLKRLEGCNFLLLGKMSVTSL